MTTDNNHIFEQIRTYGIGIIIFSSNVSNFACVKMYPIFLESIDLHGCLSIFGIGCIIGFIFVFLVLSETKGKSLDDVGVVKKLGIEIEEKISNSRL